VDPAERERVSRMLGPPPWDGAAVDAVLALVARVAGTPAPPGLPALAESDAAHGTWSDVAADPEPFLSVGLCSAAWLEAALPRLLDAARPGCWPATPCCTSTSAATTSACATLARY
jgi:hypothetical protein